jgi:hypothetical protein
MSGLTYQRVPSAARRNYAIPYGVMTVGDYDLRYWLALRLSVEANRPRAVVVENVPEMMQWARYRSWRMGWSDLGYRVSEQVIDAADAGVPQHRRRLFVVASRTRKPIAIPQPAVAHVAARACLDLDGGAAGQRRDLYRRACRVGCGEASGHHGVHGGEVRQIGQEDRQFHDLVEIAACRLTHGAQVGEDLSGLRRDVALDQFHGGWVQGDLSREIDHAVCLHGLRVGADRLRCVRGVYDCAVAHADLRVLSGCGGARA